MKVLEHIERAESVKDFFDRTLRRKLLIVDHSRLKEINLFGLIDDLFNDYLYDTEFSIYVAEKRFKTVKDGHANQIFQKSTGVLLLGCDLDDITLFETKEDLNAYFEFYAVDRNCYIEDAIVLEITSEIIDALLEQNRLERIKFLKESIDYYHCQIEQMTKELEELEKIAEM